MRQSTTQTGLSSINSTSQLTVTTTLVTSRAEPDIVAGVNALSIRSSSPPPAYTRSNPVGSAAVRQGMPSSLPSSLPANTPPGLVRGSTPNLASSSVGRGPPAASNDRLHSSGIAMPRLESLPFYHAAPIVPIPPGMEPLPSFNRTEFPLVPGEQTTINDTVQWYFASVAVNPGLHRLTWEEFRPNIEAHRGLPSPHRPDWARVRGPLAATLPRIRVLPPPPRPVVQVDGDHLWVVYVGRIPGIYSTL